jgi:uncharacterized protein (TIGR00266 family)
MEVEVLNSGGNAAVIITLQPMETCVAEGGAMIALDGNITVKTTTYQKNGGGIIKGLARMVTGESFFLNHFTPERTPGSVWLAPKLTGGINSIQVADVKLIIQAESFLCCSENIEFKFSWQGGSSLLLGENLLWAKVQGRGSVVVNAFGAIYEVVVSSANEYIVDTGHVVAFEESLDFSITKAGKSWFSSFIAGEGMVVKFKGRGRVWCQSHNRKAYGNSLGRLLPTRTE